MCKLIERFFKAKLMPSTITQLLAAVQPGLINNLVGMLLISSNPEATQEERRRSYVFCDDFKKDLNRVCKTLRLLLLLL